MPPELLLSYEQTLVYKARLMGAMQQWDRVAFIRTLADVKHPYFSADWAYLEGQVCFHSEPADVQGCERAVRRALKSVPLHQESLVLLASLHLKSPDLMPLSEAETLLANAL